MSDIATAGWFAELPRRSPVLRMWTQCHAAVRAFAAHPDPLVEASNWVALTVGSHLPFWPLYIFWAAGWEALPSSLLTAAMTPLFLAIPIAARCNGLLGRVLTPILGIANTVFTIWILGINSGTEVFLIPCAAIAAVTFRRKERLTMLVLTMLPLAVWLMLQEHPPAPLHHYTAAVARDIFILNVCSIAVLLGLFGWFQLGIYHKMEAAEQPGGLR